MNRNSSGQKVLSLLWTPWEIELVYGMNFETLIGKPVKRKIRQVLMFKWNFENSTQNQAVDLNLLLRKNGVSKSVSCQL